MIFQSYYKITIHPGLGSVVSNVATLIYPDIATWTSHSEMVYTEWRSLLPLGVSNTLNMPGLPEHRLFLKVELQWWYCWFKNCEWRLYFEMSSRQLYSLIVLKKISFSYCAFYLFHQSIHLNLRGCSFSWSYTLQWPLISHVGSNWR